MSKYASYEVCYIVVYVVNKLIEQGLIKPEDKNKALLKSEGITLLEDIFFSSKSLFLVKNICSI